MENTTLPWAPQQRSSFDWLCDSIADAPKESVALTFTSALLALLICSNCISHRMDRVPYVSESAVACLSGLVGGILVHLSFTSCGDRLPKNALRFKSNMFFDCMLPPIIYNAGFNMQKRMFFRNFLSIGLLGVVGTLLQFGMLSACAWYIFGTQPTLGLQIRFEDCLALGAIFASTDSVVALQVIDQSKHPLLYSLTFGEGVLNDATSVVLLNAVTHFERPIDFTAAHMLEVSGVFAYLFVCSAALGVAMGLLSALLMKNLYLHDHHMERELTLMLAIAFFAYGAAELCGLSSIFAIFFCAITQSHYTLHSTGTSCQMVTKQIFSTLSAVLEHFIFLYCGWTAFDRDLWSNVELFPAAGLFVLVLALLMGIRLVVVVPLCLLTNLFRTYQKITWPAAMVVWWAGIMRGVITLALAFHHLSRVDTIDPDGAFPADATVLATTLLVVLFSTIGLGAMTDTLLATLLCKVDSGIEHESTRSPSGYSLGSAGPVAAEDFHVHRWWHQLDDRYFQKVFGGRVYNNAVGMGLSGSELAAGNLLLSGPNNDTLVPTPLRYIPPRQEDQPLLEPEAQPS